MILKRAELFRSGFSTDTCRTVAFRYVCDSFTAKSAHLSTPGPTKRALAMAKWANLAAAVILLMSTINGGLTFEEAFARGTLVAKNGGAVCMCAPGKRYQSGWGPRACEWKAHRKQQVHQDWVRAKPGKRKLEELPSSSRYAAKVKNISLDWSRW